VKAGELVVSGIDAVHGAVGVVPAELDGLVMSKEMFRYRVRSGSDAVPEYLQLLLRTTVARELLMGLVTGTSNRTRLESAEQLLALPIPPLPELKVQEELATQVREAHELRVRALENLENAHESANAGWGQPARPAALDPKSFPIAEAELI
jgi:type I restriction enzyme M protein